MEALFQNIKFEAILYSN